MKIVDIRGKSESDDDQPLLPMDMDEDAEEEVRVVPYKIVRQMRTTKALGHRVNYKVRWCDANGDGLDMNLHGVWSMEFAGEIERNEAYADMVSNWKERRPKHSTQSLGKSCNTTTSLICKDLSVLHAARSVPNPVSLPLT